MRSWQEVQNTEKSIQNISMRAQNVVLAVAQSCKGVHEDLNPQLQSDLAQLTEYDCLNLAEPGKLTGFARSTMNDILTFMLEFVSRSRYKRFLYKSQDAAAVSSLEVQLTHAFQIFEVFELCSRRLHMLIFPGYKATFTFEFRNRNLSNG